MQVKWGNDFSDSFRVSNGVRQGGVLNPYLFALYLDELSSKLMKIEAGCCIGDAVLNHIFFADDICLLCPSLNGLQELVNVCSSYAISHSIVFNCKKSVAVLFPCSKFKLFRKPLIF